ncbi:hypothetical protein [Williamwhitmania taraxaci]|nr:hypothetical protein [Williamwhitmania taraxaci]
MKKTLILLALVAFIGSLSSCKSSKPCPAYAKVKAERTVNS